MLRMQYRLKLVEAEENTPEVARIGAVLEIVDAERLIAALDRGRGVHGRNDYPNRVKWHCLVAFGCLGVKSVAEGLRMLKLSPPLQALCGIESGVGIPSKFAMHRFEGRLCNHLPLLEEMFVKLVQALAELLPGFGERLATDSTKVHSLANGKKPAADEDASWKKYEHKYTDSHGQPKKSVVKWFGYKLHLVVDALYELPIAGVLTTARDNDATHFASLWRRAKKNLPDLPERAKSNALDKGYDEAATHQALWADGVEPIVAIREMTEEENQDLLPESQQRCPSNRPLQFDGFEKSRKSLRYALPKSCPKRGGKKRCEFADGCKQKLVRVKLIPDNLRHLGPVPRNTKKFERLYRMRTAVERVNGRAKKSWGLDCVRRRGIGQVRVWALLSLICMNAFAATMAQAGKLEEVRKTVYSIGA